MKTRWERSAEREVALARARAARAEDPARFLAEQAEFAERRYLVSGSPRARAVARALGAAR